MSNYTIKDVVTKIFKLINKRFGNVENKSSATIRSEITKDNVTKALGYTPYTPNEVDNKFSALETNIDWKESVDTFDDIATTYPNPIDGWTVNVKDTDYTYRYNGTKWVTISANAIPKATNNIDGLLSKEDHTKYEDANGKKHIHDNKSIIDKITQSLLNAWDSAVTHISDTVKHITSDERTNWNSAKEHADSEHAPSDAQVNTIESIKVNNTIVTPDENKSVNITIPDAYDYTTIKAEIDKKANKDHTHTTVNGHTVESDVPSDAVFTDTDTKVTQTATTNDASYPLLLAPSGQTKNTTTTSYFDSGVTLNPSTNTIAANISGNADTSTKATQDGNGNVITSTYAKTSHTHKYAGSYSASGGAIKLYYEVIFKGTATSDISTTLTGSYCEGYNYVGISGAINGYKFTQFFPISTFYKYGGNAKGCCIAIANGLSSSTLTGMVRFNDHDHIIEVNNITLYEVVLFEKAFGTMDYSD